MWVVIVRADSHRDGGFEPDAADPEARGPFDTREAAQDWIATQPFGAGWYSFRFEVLPLCTP